MTRMGFLKQQTISGANKCRRRPLPKYSVAEQPYSLTERKALTLKTIFDNMPIYIGEKELIVGTRTFFTPNEGNEDGHDIFNYRLNTYIPYINGEEIERFGCDHSYRNRTHFTPDFSIVLKKGIDGIIREAEERKKDPSLNAINIECLAGIIIAYNGLKNLILRYAEEAYSLAKNAEGQTQKELLEIARICQKISSDCPDTFHEAIQLLWFTHLGTIIESFELINYGRLDVILGEYLKDTSRDEAQQLIECLLLKMYDQYDMVSAYLGKYSAQLVVTLGGVLSNGESAVNEVTMMFLEAIDKIRLPEPEFNLRINSKNPPEFLDKAAQLTITGCNFVSYYNDNRFIQSLNQAGIPIEYARDYGFDACQDINIPGKGDVWRAGSVSLALILMDMLKEKRDFLSFEDLIEELKKRISSSISKAVQSLVAAQKQLSLYSSGRVEEYFEGIKQHNLPVDRDGNSPMAPLPLLSALFHGSIEKALDVIFEPYPIPEKGFLIGMATETINSLAAIKKVVYEDKLYTLDEVYAACEKDFDGADERIIQNILWNCPKWGNDDDYVDSIAKDILEFSLKECQKHKTYFGGRVLGGIHQAHPVLMGTRLMATPEGRNAWKPIAVTLTPENGTMKNGPTAALCSAAKIDPILIQWNFCIMVNYFSSVFDGENGKETFKSLLNGYFEMGGMQHQPNVTDVQQLKRAQVEPEKYKDLVVRLWGVSAHFVDLPRLIQDEVINRFSY